MKDVNTKSTTTQRVTRIRKKATAVSARPRLSVLRSNRYIYAQIVDTAGTTLLGVSEKALDDKVAKLAPMERAKQLGVSIAQKAKEKKISQVVFDKGSLAYHGRVKALAEGAREGGLEF